MFRREERKNALRLSDPAVSDKAVAADLDAQNQGRNSLIRSLSDEISKALLPASNAIVDSRRPLYLLPFLTSKSTDKYQKLHQVNYEG